MGRRTLGQKVPRPSLANQPLFPHPVPSNPLRPRRLQVNKELPALSTVYNTGEAGLQSSSGCNGGILFVWPAASQPQRIPRPRDAIAAVCS